MCFTVVCCNSIVFFKSVSADRNGMAAPRCLERYLVSSSVLRLSCVLQVLCFASHSLQIALELLHHGCDLNVKICTEHCLFCVNGASVAERSRFARVTVWGVAALAWNLARNARAMWGCQVTFSRPCWCCAIVFLCFACVEALCALELAHHSHVFYSI